MSDYPIKRALISVSDKQDLVVFAQGLHDLGIELISTGGSAALLRENNIPVREIADLTGFPELMDGRLKTLHPLIHGGILGLRDAHAAVAKAHHIEWIDLVVVNLYPFAEVSQQPDTSFADAIEHIDIGGPTMIRAAAKNMAFVSVVIDPQEYPHILAQIKKHQALSLQERQRLAQKAFAHTASYDACIHQYLSKKITPDEAFPDLQLLTLIKETGLRYGENPDQGAAAYRYQQGSAGILAATQHQGKNLSYNNILDADAAQLIVNEFSKPTCVIVKHTNPCGVATAHRIHEAFLNAFYADSLSAFGGIIALNRECDEATAHAVIESFFELLIAPSYSAKALAILGKKANLRVLSHPHKIQPISYQYQFLQGCVLVQDRLISDAALALKVVSARAPSEEELSNLLFAWKVVRHVKSNAIVLSREGLTVGIGPGQVSRVDALHTALRKAGNQAHQAVAASDAFFPFRDSIDLLAQAQVSAIIQPGGSIRDQDIIAACNEHNMAMVFTEKRCFKH